MKFHYEESKWKKWSKDPKKILTSNTKKAKEEIFILKEKLKKFEEQLKKNLFKKTNKCSYLIKKIVRNKK